MEFRILGPLEVVEDGQPVAVKGARERALLAYLLLHANQAVASERLIHELWGENPPARARKSLQVRVTHLRKALPEIRKMTPEQREEVGLGGDDWEEQMCRRMGVEPGEV